MNSAANAKAMAAAIANRIRYGRSLELADIRRFLFLPQKVGNVLGDAFRLHPKRIIEPPLPVRIDGVDARRVVNQIAQGAFAWLALAVNPIIAPDRLELGFRPRQTDKSRVKILQVCAQTLGGVAFGIDRDEHEIHVGGLRPQACLDLLVFRECNRAYVRAISVAKEDEHHLACPAA